MFNFRPKFRLLRFFVVQMAVVHVIIFITLTLVSFESPEAVDHVLLFFVPFILATLALGVWAFQITIRMIVPFHQNLNLLKKFIAFQLVLLFCKFQPILLKVLLKHFILDCEGAITIIIKIRGELR